MQFFFFWKASNFNQVSFFFASSLEITSRNAGQTVGMNGDACFQERAIDPLGCHS